MKIRNTAAIERFIRRHADARKPLESWCIKTNAALWRNLEDIRRTFNTADYRKPFMIFNIGGNNYRVLTDIDYVLSTVTVIRVGTHAEYERWTL